MDKSADSLLIHLVESKDDDERMPSEKPALKPEEAAILKAWIDQGAAWDASVAAMPPKPGIKPRLPTLPPGDGNPIDRILAGYLKEHKVSAGQVIDDRHFARRAFFDTIGLPPSPAELDSFEKDTSGDKRAKLVQSLLARDQDYAEHWISFWCDHLRSGTTFGIDGKNINFNGWLMTALRQDMPYDRFVRELINPGKDGPHGFCERPADARRGGDVGAHRDPGRAEHRAGLPRHADQVRHLP